MRHDQFIGQVQARARLPDRAHAERACRATLETLGERVPEGLADNLAAQLPHEIGENLRRTEVHGGMGSGMGFDRHEFIRRVADRAGVKETQAAYLVRVVMEVAGEATTGRVLDKVGESLPADIRPLVLSGSRGSID
ncbi:DUF2267 domain-containing protein [Spongiactinospora sp. 9N601]|uniref:DUF2267 domain-containing protein n=1 Tax=Spongiactinospora sp. 9N601 TaxID=3375149 RepID=UPI0037AA89F5